MYDDRTDCDLNGTCKKQKKGECTRGCVRYSMIKFMQRSSNMPRRYFKPVQISTSIIDREAYAKLYNINIEKFVEEGENLYIYSKNTGNGKTMWAAYFVRQFFKECWYLCAYERICYFIDLKELLSTMKQFESDKGVELLKICKKVKLLVLDNFIIDNLSDFDKARLLEIVEYRYSRCLSTIYTADKRPNEIQGIDRRIVSRLNDSIIVEFKAKDWRGER